MEARAQRPGLEHLGEKGEQPQTGSPGAGQEGGAISTSTAGLDHPGTSAWTRASGADQQWTQEHKPQDWNIRGMKARRG